MCECCYQDYIDMLDDMLLDEDYEFATDTLLDIRAWIEENKFITDKQITAIKNIKDSGNKYGNFIDKYV